MEESILKNVGHMDSPLRDFICFVQSVHAILKYGDYNLYSKVRLSIIKFLTLQGLGINDTMTISEIAWWTCRERHNISALVERMKNEGLVTSERDNVDRRSVKVMLTSKGREVARQAEPMATDIMNQMLRSITREDAELLQKLLEALERNAYQGLKQLGKSSNSGLNRVIALSSAD